MVCKRAKIEIDKTKVSMLEKKFINPQLECPMDIKVSKQVFKTVIKILDCLSIQLATVNWILSN